MKHNFTKRGLFVAVAAAGLLAGCQKEEGPVTLGIETEGVGGSHSGAKVIIDNTYTPVWEGGESVRINGETKDVVLTGGQAQLQGLTEAETYRAFYPASMVGSTDISNSESISMTLPSNQTYAVDANGKQQVVLPMGAYMTDNSGTLQFKNLCSLVKLTINNTNASGGATITVTGVELSTSTTGVNLCGTGSATVNGTADDAIFTVSSNGSRSITLGLGAGVEIAAQGSHEFYFVVAPFATSSSLTFTVHAVGMSDFTKTVNNKALPRNTLAGASISISGTPVPPIAGGLFQVDEQGTMVKFAPGNLRCTVYGLDTTWSFCENQYDYDVNNNGSHGTWDYFGWSTDQSNGFQYGMSQSTTTAFSTPYKGNFVDWGEAVNNQLGSGWRTLTKDEWAYIFNTRTGATIGSVHDTCRYAFAYVNGVKSIILFPNNEDFSWPNGVTIPNNINYKNGWQNASTYDTTAWKKLESAGCVLLPAAGCRKGSLIENDNQVAYYWTKTPGGTNQTAYAVTLNAYPHIAYAGINRSNGYSVRLVQNQTQK